MTAEMEGKWMRLPCRGRREHTPALSSNRQVTYRGDEPNSTPSGGRHSVDGIGEGQRVLNIGGRRGSLALGRCRRQAHRRQDRADHRGLSDERNPRSEGIPEHRARKLSPSTGPIRVGVVMPAHRRQARCRHGARTRRRYRAAVLAQPASAAVHATRTHQNSGCCARAVAAQSRSCRQLTRRRPEQAHRPPLVVEEQHTRDRGGVHLGQQRILLSVGVGQLASLGVDPAA